MQKAFTARIVRLGTVLAASVALAIAAQAQAPSQTQGGMMGATEMQPGGTQGGGMKGGMMPGMMQGGGMMGMTGMMENCPMGGGTAAYTEGRLAFLKADLAITDQQKAAWEAMPRIEPRRNERRARCHDEGRAGRVAGRPPRRADRAMEATAATLKELKPALTALYAALSDEQKKKADALLTGMGCMM